MMTILGRRHSVGRDVLRQWGHVALASFLILFLFLSFSSAPQVSAQILPDPLNTNASGSQAINVPKYNGVESSISDYLCAPSDNTIGTALYDCISKGYRFGIAFGAIALVFFVVFAGYMYMVGGETGKEKGKSIFLSAITGMALILSSYVLLSFINPELTKIKIIQPPIFDAGNLPSCQDIGFQGACVLPNGQVQVNSGGKLIINGYDLSLYAPETGGINQGYAGIITKMYDKLKDKDFSTAQKITDYMKSVAKSTPLTGEMVMSSSQKYGGVDTKLMVALMQVDSVLGTQGKGAHTHNPGNVGTWPGHDTSFGSWQEGVDAVAKFLNKHKL